MAVLHYTATATTSLHHQHHRRRLTATEIFNPRKPILLVSCVHTSFPTKHNKRKNHLRQKILKTLPKPLTPKLPPSNPIIPIESSPIQELKEPEIVHKNEEVQKVEEFREVEVSLPSGVSVDGNVSILSKNQIFKYGLWLFGAFVFQTVCAVWIFGSADFDTQNENLNGNKKSSVLEVAENGNGKVDNGSVDSLGYVDELERERKIEEIRVMARDARKEERLESKKKGFVSDENDESEEGKDFRSGIEEEVDNRLIKLRNKLENARENKGNGRKDGIEKGENEIEGNDALLFKKKYKFKGLSGDPREKPKGFVGSDDKSITNLKESGNSKEDELFESGNGGKDAIGSKGSNAILVVDEDQTKSMPEVVESTKNTSKKVTRARGTRNQGKGKVTSKPKGTDQEKNNGRSKSKKLNDEAAKLRGSSARDTAVINGLSKGNGSLKGKESGDAKSETKSRSETDFWWLKLPYVLAILMQRGHDGEGGEGLYTLKSTSSEENLISHIVAFEDRVEANNFCYLLQSFFEDLEDFKADVVPLTTKELSEDVKLRTARVFVVKRGQLRLYAGQPLDEAEMALRAMVKQG
ncbi:hypothetical protein ACJIZ3_014154 [Penstemon smallii]|uniref:Uncharacterized protein n=1 Tax=Penstemon smallii TaxID=265156 RepID=A0ABD3RM14_9LAMI